MTVKSESPAHTYSVIVAVYNRLIEVKELLQSAEKLEFDRNRFEFLFVDDGSNDGFDQFIEEYDSQTGVVVKAVFQQNEGPGSARNHGMQVSEKDYFLFLDSDCMVPPHWLMEIDAAVVSERLDAFGGPDTYHDSFSSLLKAINYSMTSFLGTGGTRGGSKRIGKFYPRSFNMGISRQVYQAIGGMNALRHGQDMDYSARIYEAGFKVGLIQDAFVYHKRRTSLWKFFKQIFNWGVARINLGRMHPQLLKPIHFLPSLLIVTVMVLLIVSVVLSMKWLALLVCAGYLLVSLTAFFQSYFMYNSLKISFLSSLTLTVQVLAYGLGMMWALVQMLWKKEATGFVKNYYGKKKRDLA